VSAVALCGGTERCLWLLTASARRVSGTVFVSLTPLSIYLAAADESGLL